jgi:hypothetical protein
MSALEQQNLLVNARLSSPDVLLSRLFVSSFNGGETLTRAKEHSQGRLARSVT